MDKNIWVTRREFLGIFSGFLVWPFRVSMAIQPQAHVKRIYAMDSQGNIDQSTWIDVLRLDSIRTVDPIRLHQGAVWYLKWDDDVNTTINAIGDAQTEINNPDRMYELRTIYDTTSDQTTNPPQSGDPGTVDLNIVESYKSSGRGGNILTQLSQYIFKNNPLDDQDGTPNIIRRFTAVRVPNNDLGGADQNGTFDLSPGLTVGWTDYSNALFSGNIDMSQASDVEITDRFYSFLRTSVSSIPEKEQGLGAQQGSQYWLQAYNTTSQATGTLRNSLENFFAASPPDTTKIFRLDPLEMVVNVNFSSSILIVGGDYRDADNATVVWFKETVDTNGNPQLTEYASNKDQPIAPDLTDLTFIYYGDGTTPVPPLPASCTAISLGRGNWSTATWGYTEDGAGEFQHSPPSTEKGSLFYDKNGIEQHTPPTITFGSAAGLIFSTPWDMTFDHILEISGEFDFPQSGGASLFYSPNAYITVSTSSPIQYSVIDNLLLDLLDETGNFISETSILPGDRNNFATAIQDSAGNSYALETDDSLGIWATKRDITGTLIWEYPLNYEDKQPVAIARTKNLVAVLCSPDYTFANFEPSWGVNWNSSPPLFTPPFLPNSGPYTSSADAVAAVQGTTAYGYWGYSVPVVTAGESGGDLSADGALLRSLIEAAQATEPPGGAPDQYIAGGVYGSDGLNAYIPAQSNIFVLDTNTGKLIQTISWGSTTRQIVPIPDDVDANIFFKGSLRCAASSPNY